MESKDLRSMKPEDSGRENVERQLRSLQQTVTEVYKQELWTAVRTGMAVIASLSFKSISNPISLFYEGGSGRGKSTVINILDADRAETKARVYRLDKFTTKSFVTHAANVGHDKIKEIDLLPKLNDKVLVSKELAPMFRGRDEELRDSFSILAAVLDGKGLVTSSGVHGTRGYDERCVFNWLGATTPIPARTDAIMAQLGNRLLRYEIFGAESTEEELLEFAATYDPVDKEDMCRKAVNDFIAAHFAKHPPRTVDPREITVPDALLRELVRLCKLIAHGRVEVRFSTESLAKAEEAELTPGIPEGPYRVILYTRTIAQGLALLAGRNQVNSDDLSVIRHIAFSSIPNTRRDVLRAVLLNGGQLDTATAETMLRLSKPTARNRMKELAATGIVSWQDGLGNRGQSITLEKEWNWLLRETPDEAAPDESEEFATGVRDVPLWVMVQPFKARTC